jgi:hypothetical protein
MRPALFMAASSTEVEGAGVALAGGGAGGGTWTRSSGLSCAFSEKVSETKAMTKTSGAALERQTFSAETPEQRPARRI